VGFLWNYQAEGRESFMMYFGDFNYLKSRPSKQVLTSAAEDELERSNRQLDGHIMLIPLLNSSGIPDDLLVTLKFEHVRAEKGAKFETVRCRSQ
jgi:hypothetical protein